MQWLLASAHCALQKSRMSIMIRRSITCRINIWRSVIVSKMFNGVKIDGQIGYNLSEKEPIWISKIQIQQDIYAFNGLVLRPASDTMSAYGTLDLSCKMAIKQYSITSLCRTSLTSGIRKAPDFGREDLRRLKSDITSDQDALDLQDTQDYLRNLTAQVPLFSVHQVHFESFSEPYRWLRLSKSAISFSVHPYSCDIFARTIIVPDKRPALLAECSNP